MMPLLSLAVAGCLAIGAASDRIVVRDLAPSFPALAAVAPDTPLGWAPVAGARRIFRIAELRRIAARFGLDAGPEQDICVERKTMPLDPERMLECMRKQLPQARIEILDFSRQPAPEGDLEFLLAGLRPTAAGGFWSGTIRYAGGRRFAVWAQVRVTAAEPRVVAATELQPGRAIEAAQLRLETREVFPDGGTFASSLEEVAGRIPRRSVAAGTALRRQWLEAPRDVLRGDTVRVEAKVGAARIEGEGVAEASGSAGALIPVVNPVSRRRFLARVEGKGKVTVRKGTP